VPNINISLPDGSTKAFKRGISGLEIAKSISEGLGRNALSIEVNGEIWDLNRTISKDSSIKILTWSDSGGKYTFWHSSSHLMAEALKSLFPKVKFGIGPPIENGFYYDVDFGEITFSNEDLLKVESKMIELARKNNSYVRSEVSKTEAVNYFTKLNDPYKLELLQDLDDGTITFYKQGEFTDLCRGPHIPNTGLIKAIKLLSVAGAYWRGSEKNKMLTRIYGITFPKQKELESYLVMLEEAKKRDHRKLGKELELFTFSDKVGIGLPLWLPKGTIIRQKLEQYLSKAQVEAGYQQVITPHIGGKELYVTSGHYEKYGSDSFQPIQTPNLGEEFMLKPMNCPHHCEIYKFKPRSYKDLPIRLAEFGTVYRYEQSGEVHGLTRVRGFTQDDAHIFCRPDQIKEEFCKVIDLVLKVFNCFGFKEYTAQISLRDASDTSKYIGDAKVWDKAEKEIQEASNERGLKTVTVNGEAAFYGPKLDFMVSDAIGRNWQLGTIQVDYQLPQRFDLEYVGADNQKHRPVMIHRAPFGSMERFVALLIEHCGGNFPIWLSPEQIAVLPISERFNDYANQILAQLSKSEIRGYVDSRDEKIGRKIRDAEIEKVPFMLVVGEKEANENKVAVRQHGSVDQGNITLEEFVTKFHSEFQIPN